MANDFNVDAVKRKLGHLHNSQRLQALRAELLKPWPGMVHDVRVIAEQMAEELYRNRETHPFLQDFEVDGDKISFRLPPWVGAARQQFKDLYNSPEDEVRWQKALTVFQERLFRQLEGTSDAAGEDLIEILQELMGREEMPTGTA
jgi:hypothetical protein